MVAEDVAVVLVVEPDPDIRKRLASWLEGAGLEVLTCPGPSAPEYVCIGGRGLPCPLVEPADVVVLDPRLPNADLMTGTSGEQLLTYYLAAAKPVIALGSLGAISLPYRDEVGCVPLHVERRAFVHAVTALLGRSPTRKFRVLNGGE